MYNLTTRIVLGRQYLWHNWILHETVNIPLSLVESQWLRSQRTTIFASYTCSNIGTMFQDIQFGFESRRNGYGKYNILMTSSLLLGYNSFLVFGREMKYKPLKRFLSVKSPSVWRILPGNCFVGESDVTGI